MKQRAIISAIILLIMMLFACDNCVTNDETTMGKVTPINTAAVEIRNDIPASMPIAQFLGKTRFDVETLMTPQESLPSAWVRYTPDLWLQYQDEVVVAMKVKVSGSKTCEEAVRYLGFQVLADYYQNEGECIWPEGSLGYDGKLYKGRYDFSPGQLEVTKP
jgi:hypothetical protein